MKVLFYVHRISFIKNWVQNLGEYLKDNNVDVFVFLFDNNDNTTENDTGINVINISGLHVPGIISRIRVIKPDVFITLGYQSIIELLLVRISRSLNIKCIYIQHGIISLHNSTLFARIGTKNLYSSIITYLYYFILYSEYLLFYKCKLIIELRILMNKLFRNSSEGMGINKYLLFSKNAYNIHKRIFNYLDNEVEIIGYPVFAKRSSLKITSTFIPRNKKYVLYLQDNFIQANFTEISYEEEREYLAKIIKTTKDNGFLFVIQLHPLENIENYIDFSKNENIFVIQVNNLANIVKSSSFVIGHSSAALFTAILLNKPLLLFDYPKLVISLDFFSEVGIHVKSLIHYSEILNSLNEIDAMKYNSFKEKHLGTKNNFEDYGKAIVNFIQSQKTEYI